jgi:phosphoribosylformimino-5-aminoimidazole carboxamide ribonucleotide (ProFAR) isomerase
MNVECLFAMEVELKHGTSAKIHKLGVEKIALSSAAIENHLLSKILLQNRKSKCVVILDIKRNLLAIDMNYLP